MTWHDTKIHDTWQKLMFVQEVTRFVPRHFFGTQSFDALSYSLCFLWSTMTAMHAYVANEMV